MKNKWWAPELTIFTFLAYSLNCVFFSLSTQATVCLDAQNFSDLNNQFNIIVEGRVKDISATDSPKGNTKLVVEVLKYAKGTHRNRQWIAFAQSSQSPSIFYRKGEVYYFPVEFYRGRANGEKYEMIASSEGCPIYKK